MCQAKNKKKSQLAQGIYELCGLPTLWQRDNLFKELKNTGKNNEADKQLRKWSK